MRATFASFSPCGKFIVTNHYDDHQIKVWDFSTGEVVATLLSGRNVVFTSFSPCSKFVLSIEKFVSLDGYTSLSVWDVSTAQVVKHIDETGNNVRRASFSPCGQYIVTGRYFGKSLRLRKVSTGEIVAKNTIDTEWLHHPPPFPICRDLELVPGLEEVQEVPSFREQLLHEPKQIRSPCGNFVLILNYNQTAVLHDAFTCEPLHVLNDHNGWCRNASFSPCGRYVLRVSYDDTARVWKLPVRYSYDYTSLGITAYGYPLPVSQVEKAGFEELSRLLPVNLAILCL